MEPNKPLLLDDGVFESLVEWAKNAKRGHVAIVKGASTGCGITTAILRAIERAGCDAMAAAPSSTSHRRLKDFFEDACKSSVTALTKRKKILVIDPVDALLSDQTTSTDTLKYMENPKKLPTICAGFARRASLAKVIDSSGKTDVVTTFEFPAIDDDVVISHVRSIYPHLRAETIAECWSSADGDLRACLASLDFAGKESTLAHVMKDTVCDGIDAIKALLYDRDVTMEDAARMYERDGHLIEMGVFENYPPASTSVNQCVGIAEGFETADAIEEAIHGKQQWDLEPYAAYFVAANPAITLRSGGGTTKKKTAPAKIERVGTVWSRMNNQRGKLKSLNAISHQFAERSRVVLPPEDLAQLRSMLGVSAERQDFETMHKLAGTLDDKTVLSIMRLAKSGYTQTHHTKFKKYRANAEPL